MRYVRRFADFPAEPGTHRPEFIAHLESCSVIKGGIPAGTDADPLHRHPVDQFYFVLDGEIDVQLGTGQVHAGPDTLVHIPAGTPHFASNKRDIDMLQLELLLPTHVPAKEGKLVPLFELCDTLGDRVPEGPLGTPVANGWVQPLGDPSLETQILASRASGSEHGLVTISRLAPSDSPPHLHVHEFDELYFVLDGELTAEIGATRHHAMRHELVIVPAQVPHRTWNQGPAPERHLTILTPEPETGTLADWAVEVDYGIRSA